MPRLKINKHVHVYVHAFVYNYSYNLIMFLHSPFLGPVAQTVMTTNGVLPTVKAFYAFHRRTELCSFAYNCRRKLTLIFPLYISQTVVYMVQAAFLQFQGLYDEIHHKMATKNNVNLGSNASFHVNGRSPTLISFLDMQIIEGV